MVVFKEEQQGGRFFWYWKILRMRFSVSLAEPDRGVEKGERGTERSSLRDMKTPHYISKHGGKAQGERSEAVEYMVFLVGIGRAARFILLLGGGLHDLAVLGDPQKPVGAGGGCRGGGQASGGQLRVAQDV